MDRRQLLTDLLNQLFAGNQANFAKAIKRSPAQVNHWLTGHRSLGDAGARHIELTLGLEQGFFDGKVPYGKEGIINIASSTDGVAETVAPYQVPQLGEGFTRIDIPDINVIEWGHLNELLESPMFKTPDKVGSNPRLFGLKIQDDTNEPKLMQGSIIEINMDRQAKPGDFVLARYDQDSPPTIKQLIQDGGRTFLKPFNPRYPIITPSQLEIVGVIQRKIIIEEF
jgi:hypothetical protein